MISADVLLSQRVAPGADTDYSSGGVDLNGCLRRARDGQMPGGAEERLNLYHSAVDVDAVQDPPSDGEGYGREYAQNAERDGELENGKGVPHVSFRRVSWLDSI